MLDFIVNPIAGDRTGKKIKVSMAKIEAYLKEKNVDYRITHTASKENTSALTKSLIAEGATDLIIVGGDGTLHEVLNAFSNFDRVNLGIIPLGTGNDFAASINLPTDPIKAVDVILNGKPQYTDFMQMPTVRGLNIIGMGIDVDVLKRYNALKKKTKFGYTKCLVKTLFKFEYSDFVADLNGNKKNYHSFIACIANGYRYGGGIPICPPANPTDKKLDFVAVREMPKLKIIPAFIKLKKGKIEKSKEFYHENMTEIKIEPNGNYTVNVDGELYDNIPFEVKIVSDTLKIYR